MSDECKHTRTYAVDTHDRLDCIDCDKSWEGPDIVKMESTIQTQRELLEKAKGIITIYDNESAHEWLDEYKKLEGE